MFVNIALVLIFVCLVVIERHCDTIAWQIRSVLGRDARADHAVRIVDTNR